MTRYSWSDVDQLEDHIASGRFSAQLSQHIAGMQNYSMSARRDAALAELLAQSTSALNVKAFGAKGDGAANDRGAIQEALDAADAAGGLEVYVPEGTYLIGPGSGARPSTAGEYSLQLGDNVTLRMAPNAVLVKNFTSVNGSLDSLIRNEDMENGNANVSVIGGRLKATNALHTGKLLSFWFCAGVTLDRTRFEGVFDDWNTNFRDCDDVSVLAVFIDSGQTVFEDGLHFQGCRRVLVSHCSVTCGDDAIAIVEESNFATRDCTDIEITTCYLYSKVGNAIKIQSAAGQTPSTRAIRKVLVSDCGMKSDGGAGNPGIYIRDLTNTGVVSDITFTNVILDASANNAEIKIDGATSVTWTNVTIRNPRDRVRIDNATDITFNNVKITGLRGASQQCLYVGASGPVTNIKISKGYYAGATAQGILVGSGGAVTDAHIDGVTIEDCDSDGLNIGVDADAQIKGTNITSKGNGGWGINVNAGATDVSLTGNKVPNNASGGITAPTHTYRRNNRVTTGAMQGQATMGGTPSSVSIDATGLYVPLPGASNANIRTPTESLTGALALIARITPDDWTPTTEALLVEKWNTTGDQRSLSFRLRTSGDLILFWSTDGTAGGVLSAVSTVVTGLADGSTKYVAVEFNPNNGANRIIKFWMSDDGVAWTQLGATISSTTTSYFDSSAEIWCGTNGLGKLRYAAIRATDLSGALLVKADVPTDATFGATSWVASGTGETWTVNGTAPIGIATVTTTEILSSDTPTLSRATGSGAARGHLQVTSIGAGSFFVIESLKADTTRETNDGSTVFWELPH